MVGGGGGGGGVVMAPKRLVIRSFFVKRIS